MSKKPREVRNLPHRILVVDDEPMARWCNADTLIQQGYEVDAAENGAAAWDLLQAKSYDPVITDNGMPELTGLQLIGKVQDAGMTVPVMMAMGISPEEEFTSRPWLRPAATLLKPYTLAKLLETVKTSFVRTPFKKLRVQSLANNYDKT